MADTETQDKQSQEDFDRDREAQRSSQNLTQENAVPEQRPQAFLTADTGPSELTQKLRDAGDLHEPVQEPMNKAAYDKASSDAQMKKAEKDSVSEGIHPGSGVRATAGPHEGRVFAVTRVTRFGSVADMVRSATGNPEQLYNTPKGVELRAVGDERDGEIVVLEDDDLEKAELVKLNEGWRGTRVGRRH
jgi:hypothetical protein